MSRIDAYEYERKRRNYKGRTYKGRGPNRPGPGKRANTKEVQMALKLMGGTTAKDKGAPFDDPIPF